MIFCALIVVLGQVHLPQSLANPSVSSEDNTKTCTLPPYPHNGLWEVVRGHAQPGDEVDISTVIKFRCKEGYKLTSNNAYVVCDHDYDVNKVPECGKLCPPLYSSSTMTLKCIDRNGQDIKCSEATDGTYLSYECAPFHETPLGYRKNLLCIDGSWNYQPISNIISNDKFKGESRRFLGDIALLQTKDIIGLSEVVQPVCINNINNIFLHVGDIGEIAGFGLDETGKPSQRIRVLKIPYKYEPNCAAELPRDWADKYHLPDKMCAGFTNMSKGICRGDSGSGLVFKNFEDNRYYVHGVASLAPGSKGQCNIQQNSLYTKVSFYFNFIDKELSKGYLEDCKLPAHPEHGQWVLADGRKKEPGDLVASNTVLKMSCNRPYRLSGHPVVHCDAAPSDMPVCERTKTLCKDTNSRTIDCSELSEGHLSYSCSEDYISLPKGANTVRYCKDGDWNSSAPLCLKKIEIKDNSTLPVVTPIPTEAPPPTENSTTSRIKVICTYASWWSYEGINPEDMDPFLCDYMVYAFAGIWTYGDVRVQDDNLDIDRDGRRGLYRRTTDLKLKNPKLKVILGIGGSAASNGSLFSDLCRDMRKIDQFIKSSMWLMKEYKFDGLDIDWPYPFPEPYDAEYVWERIHLNLAASAKNWMEAGISKSKLVMSVAFFGRSFNLADKRDHDLRAPITGAGPGVDGGFVRWNEICLNYENYTSVWDDEQKVNYKYKDNAWIGYGNKDSIWIKGQYVKKQGFFGVNVYPIDGDDVLGKCGRKQQLLKHLHGGLGNNFFSYYRYGIDKIKHKIRSPPCTILHGQFTHS
ncbi:unnamed protein product [Callosobruchus maculatus]|uniref:Sushi domain-containing protein n=1 Tax=Callosobruchus maculatus TaxID=64391 RepID=A0A653CWS8_CALMS|nr:unnamed protein product [Callosobruchus maculatus]